MHKKRITIATIYSYEPIIAGVIKLGCDLLYLLTDFKPDDTQKKAIDEVKEALSDNVIIKEIQTSVYDIVKVAQSAIEIIDSLDQTVDIILNISAARKTKSLGLLYAGYARATRINKIVYITKEEKEIIILPILSFNLNKSQKKVLVHIKQEPFVSNRHFNLSVSKSMYYKTLRDLKKMALLDVDNCLTSAGEISLL